MVLFCVLLCAKFWTQDLADCPWSKEVVEFYIVDHLIMTYEYICFKFQWSHRIELLTTSVILCFTLPLYW